MGIVLNSENANKYFKGKVLVTKDTDKTKQPNLEEACIATDLESGLVLARRRRFPAQSQIHILYNEGEEVGLFGAYSPTELEFTYQGNKGVIVTPRTNSERYQTLDEQLRRQGI